MTTRKAAHIAWLAAALLPPLVIVARVVFAVPTDRELVGSEIAFVAGMIPYAAAGAMILSRRPDNGIGRLLVIVGAVGALSAGLSMYTDARPPLPGREWTGVVAGSIWPGSLGSLVLMLQLFPDGQVLTSRWRFGIWLTVVAAVVTSVGTALTPGPLPDFEDIQNPIGVELARNSILEEGGIGWLLLPASILVAAASVFVRFRRSTGERRQQLKWLAFGGSLLLVAWLLVMASWESSGSALNIASIVALAIALISLPVAIGIAILKYRLYDIDVVINKTVVYGALAGFITLVYVGIVVGIGTAIGQGDRPNLGLSILATAVVAVAFQPVRERVQRFANRLVYGKRATPYEVLSHFGERMASTVATEDLLPRMAEILAQGTGAARTEVWLKVGAELRQAASWPQGNGDAPKVLPLSAEDLPAIEGADRSLPVRHQGELLGALSVTKAKAEPLTPSDTKLLEDLASQAGLVLRNVKLIEELRASRQRIVSAQDEERRRIERNIHDGAQQQLVALNVKLGLAKTLLRKDAEKTQHMIEQLQQETVDALENLRDLARGIFPPLLADRGLVSALAAQVRKATVPVELQADGIGRFERDAEAAVYFCVLEALQNVAKYANASRVRVGLSREDGALTFLVQDDGQGFDPATVKSGSGLTNMTDRIEALGGTLEIRSEPGKGTKLIGAVPVRENETARKLEPVR